MNPSVFRSIAVGNIESGKSCGPYGHWVGPYILLYANVLLYPNSLTRVWNSAGSLIICQERFRSSNSPCFLSYSFPVLYVLE
jgi:hypothetical protein